MKKYIIKTLSLLILFILIIGTPYSNADNKKSKSSIHLDITSDEFIEDFNPNGDMSKEVDAIASPIANSIVNITNVIIGIIQVIGGILAVISITIFGINLVLSTHKPLAIDLGFGKSPDDMKALLDFGRGMLIGSILLLAGGTFVRLILKLLI